MPSDTLPRRILLADADAFFVAVARLADPEGAGAAPLLIVGGSRESRGVVCSASYPVRRYGVRSGMSIAQALRLCPEAMCVPVPRGACVKTSHAIGRVLKRFAPVVEGASIDEWYLDLAGTERLYREEPLSATAQRIREAVHAETGFSVSIGGGTSKLVAKLAAQIAKPTPDGEPLGVYVVAPGDEPDFVLQFALADIPLIGPALRERLDRAGLRTVAAVRAQSREELSRWLGEREARWLYERVRGLDATPVEQREVPQSISREETFARDIASDAVLERQLLALVVHAAADLRATQMTARTVRVKLRDADFTTRQASRTLPEPVVADRVIYATARALLRGLRRARRTPARLIGINLSSLAVDPSPVQLALFDSESAQLESNRDRAIARAVDELRARFGPDAILPAELLRE